MPPIPKDFGPRGRRLWRSIAAADPLAVTVTDPRRDIALEACRAADQLDALAGLLERDGLMLASSQGERVHPALAETNRLRPLLARLIVALRLPDTATGVRPQHRPMRGTQSPSRIGAGKVSSLDRARATG